MKHINTWHPDTCDCVVHYEWDDAVPVEQRIHTPVKEFKDAEGNIRVPQPCTIHKDLTDHVEHHDHVLAENQTKNGLHMHIEQLFPHLHDEVENKQGIMVKQFKKGVRYNWRFEGKGKNRKLIASITGGEFNDEHKNMLKEKLATLKKSVTLE